MKKVMLDMEDYAVLDYKYLKDIDINDSFFDSLKEDYLGFSEWFLKKQKERVKAYVQERDGKVLSFLLLKIEDEQEKYNDFLKPFKPARRLKISTLKEIDPDRKMGDIFLKIALETAIKENISEIYTLVFDKHKHLIEILEKHGFKKYTKKKTLTPSGVEELENVLVKKVSKKDIE